MANNLTFLRGLSVLTALSFLLIATGTRAVETTSDSKDQLAPKQAPRADFVVPKLIDFEAFKKQFKKHYNSLAEEVNRKLYFIPRAMSAMVSSLRYKLGYDSCYKRVNELSDYTNAELDRMENKVLKEMAEDGTLDSEDEIDQDNTAGGQARGAAVKDLGREGGSQKRSRRRKRDTAPPLEWHKLQSYEMMRWTGMVPNPRYFYDSQMSYEDRAQLPNEVFQDYRWTNCIAPVRHQGDCGCCYAFAILSILEYQICRRAGHGKIMSLSPQYIVDCGNGRYNNQLMGCAGGYVKDLARFVNDFGLHRMADYPYAGMLQQCPFDLDSNPIAAGYLRMNLAHAVSIHQDHWERILDDGGPLMVHVAGYRGMLQYGGGIDYAENCYDRPAHEMVLIGHGREGGVHYWIIRNTHGESWGEQGYWRLAKEAAPRCVSKYGNAFGTQDGLEYTARAKGTLNSGDEAKPS